MFSVSFIRLLIVTNFLKNFDDEGRKRLNIVHIIKLINNFAPKGNLVRLNCERVKLQNLNFQVKLFRSALIFTLTCLS